MVQRISVSPDPVPQNGVLEICYDFSGGASSPVTLKLAWDGITPEIEVPLTANEHCTFVAVPPKVPGGMITDSSNQSEDRAVSVKAA